MATSYIRETLELHGAYPDLVPQDAPATGWNQTRNVFFEDGATWRVRGDTPAWGIPTTNLLGLVFYTNAAGEHFWVWASATELKAWDGSIHHDLKPASGWAPGAQSIVTLITFNGAVIINDSLGGPLFWNGSPASDFAALPNWPSGWRCLAMRSHKSFLFAIGRLDTGGMQRVSWSDAAEAGTLPATWTPALENLAGFVDLLAASSPCFDGFTLRDELLVMKGRTCWALSYVGGNDVFAARERWTRIGIAGTDGWCVGPNDQALFFGSDGDIYRTDGINYASILDGVAQRTYYAEADPEQLRRIAAASLPRAGLSILAYPTVGAAAANRAIVFSWATGEIGFRDMPDITCLADGRQLDSAVTVQNAWNTATGTWNTDQAPWNFELSAATGNDVIGGSLAGAWWLTGETAATVPLPAHALKQGLAFGDPQAMKLAARIWPKFTGVEGDVVQVRAGAQAITDGPVTWSPVVDHVIGAGQPVDLFASGRYLALEVSTEAVGSAWRLGSVDVEFRPQGGW